MKQQIVFALATLSLLSVGPGARAQELPNKWGSVEVGGGPYTPNVDDEFGGAATPYRDVFGNKAAPMFRLHVSKTLLQSSALGALDLGFKTGFWSKAGHALDPDGNPTGDRTRFTIVPTSLTLTYRVDSIYERLRVPLVPYGRVALERYNWWTSKEDESAERGATNGWSATAGVGLVLDWMDPGAARDLENEAGVAHTIVYFDVTRSKVDDFGSDESWDLSEKQKLFWSVGLMVVF